MRTPGSKSAQSGACISRSAADRMTEAPTSPESDSGEPDSSAPDCCGSPAPAVGGTNSGVGEPLGGALAGVAAGVSAGVSGRAFGAVSGLTAAAPARGSLTTGARGSAKGAAEIGRATVGTPVHNAQLVCGFL